MSAKLKLNPKVAYFIGMNAYSPSKAIGIVTSNPEIIRKFIRTATEELGIVPTDIRMEEKENVVMVYFYNSKLKKLLQKALERKGVTFKYKNDYAAGYFAGIFDATGGLDAKGAFIRRLTPDDALLLEKLGWHTRKSGYKTYIISQKSGEPFADFIKTHSAKLQ